MNSVRQISAKAGSVMGLLFFLVVLLLECGMCLSVKGEAVPTFREIQSTCIDLAHYDAKTKELTVRYVDRDTDRFYRYSKVPAEVWRKIRELNETGGVGNYFTITVVQHPEKYPFEKISIREFKTVPKKNKAGDSK